jgi:hypothetical protein
VEDATEPWIVEPDPLPRAESVRATAPGFSGHSRQCDLANPDHDPDGPRSSIPEDRDRKVPQGRRGDAGKRVLEILQGLAYSGGKSILNKHRPQLRPSFPQTPEVRVLLFFMSVDSPRCRR